MTSINASLSITVSTGGFQAVQPTAPTQLFTPATGQRAFTLSDIISNLNESINGNTDPTSEGADSPDILYSFNVVGDGMIVIDAISTVSQVGESVWDNDREYMNGIWQ